MVNGDMRAADTAGDAAVHPWRSMIHVENTGGALGPLNAAQAAFQPERWVYAEGDSWFDKFTPFGAHGTNLLETIRTPFLTAVCDVSHIGDEVRDMVDGRQARQTAALFKLWNFDAILLSAGGNDLKNAFAQLVVADANRTSAPGTLRKGSPLGRFADAGTLDGFFAGVVADIRRFVQLRDEAGDPTTRKAPILLHGYDHLQPRPAGALLFAGSRIGSGPWLYPALKQAGMSDEDMRAAAADVIDALNERLRSDVAVLPNVTVLDQRGLLTIARPGTTGADGDWLDEIHPTADGFAKLARGRWELPLAAALGWTPPQAGLGAPGAAAVLQPPM